MPRFVGRLIVAVAAMRGGAGSPDAGSAIAHPDGPGSRPVIVSPPVEPVLVLPAAEPNLPVRVAAVALPAPGPLSPLSRVDDERQR